jgi:hypothetical protein
LRRQRGPAGEQTTLAAALPASPQAQQKLKAAGIDRPVHDSGHRDWNGEVRRRLEQISDDLTNQGLTKGTNAYDRRAREQLEKLQNNLRQSMLRAKRLTRNGSTNVSSCG